MGHYFFAIFNGCLPTWARNIFKPNNLDMEVHELTRPTSIVNVLDRESPFLHPTICNASRIMKCRMKQGTLLGQMLEHGVAIGLHLKSTHYHQYTATPTPVSISP